MRKQVETRLREAGRAYKQAPRDLLEAILEAAGEPDATTVEIAKACDFAYSPTYIGKLISKHNGPRPPGRRPATASED